MIDFVDLCNVHNEPIIKTCTRTAEGYHYHLEENTTQYGLPLQRNFDLYIDFYDGPFEGIYAHDYRVEPDYIEKRDKEKEEELRKQHDAERTRSIESRGMLEGKPTVHIDTRLPVSFNRK